MRRLVVSSVAEERLAVARRWLGEQAGPVPGGVVPAGAWVVGPTLGAVADLVRGAAAEAGGLLGVERWTVGLLAARLAAGALAESGAPLSRLGSEAVAARALTLCREEGGLEHLVPVAEAPGLPRRVATTLSELRSHAVEPADLAAGGAPARDLGRLLAAYRRTLDEARLIDRVDLLERAAERLAAVGAGPATRPLLLLDPVVDDPAERRLLEALTTRAASVLVVAPDFDEAAIEGFERLLEVSSERVGESAGCSRLASVHQRLFRPAIEANGPPPPDGNDGSFDLLSAPGEARECAELVRRARDRAADGVPFEDIALLLRAPESYLPLVEEALERAGVPAFFSRGTQRPHAAGRALLTLLDCAAEGASASRFAEYLSLGQVPRSAAPGGGAAPGAAQGDGVTVPWVAAEGDEPTEGSDGDALEGEESAAGPSELPTPRAWERLLVDAAVVGGSDRWRRRLAGLAAELAAQDREAIARGEEPRHERRRARLDSLARFALPLVERLLDLPEEAPWGEWLDRLERLATAALVRPEAVLRVLAELRPMAEVGPVGLVAVRRVLEERLSSVAGAAPLYRYGRLFVGSIDEARGRSFDTVLLPGLAEGIFPRRSTEDALLLDGERRDLAAGLPGREERVEAERRLLRVAVGAARRRLIASFPSQDLAAARSRVPSLYALDLLQAADGRLPGLEDLERRAASASSSTLGWPAPRRPATAIDDVEYDLAILEPLVRRRRRDAAGAGRYLLDVNPHLGRALRARWYRWASRFSAADGLVDPDRETAEALVPYRLDRRAYSATALERFAACPYRFFLASLMHLRPRAAVTPPDRLEPRTRGRLFHRIQYELLTELAAADRLPVSVDGLDDALERLDAVVKRVAAEVADELAPPIPRVWGTEMAALLGDLRGWIKSMAAEPASWRPRHFELAFGLDGEAVTAAGCRFKGIIDLVEADEGRDLLRVTDHKTGRAPDDDRFGIGGGERLQPLIYSLVAEALLERPVEEARLFYCTQRGGYRQLVVRPDEAQRRRLDEVLQLIDRSIERGFLPAAPREKACERCDFRPVCGPYEELRVARKHPGRLGELLAVRRMP